MLLANLVSAIKRMFLSEMWVSVPGDANSDVLLNSIGFGILHSRVVQVS